VARASAYTGLPSPAARKAIRRVTERRQSRTKLAGHFPRPSRRRNWLARDRACGRRPIPAHWHTTGKAPHKPENHSLVCGKPFVVTCPLASTVKVASFRIYRQFGWVRENSNSSDSSGCGAFSDRPSRAATCWCFDSSTARHQFERQSKSLWHLQCPRSSPVNWHWRPFPAQSLRPRPFSNADVLRLFARGRNQPGSGVGLPSRWRTSASRPDRGSSQKVRPISNETEAGEKPGKPGATPLWRVLRCHRYRHGGMMHPQTGPSHYDPSDQLRMRIRRKRRFAEICSGCRATLATRLNAHQAVARRVRTHGPPASTARRKPDYGRNRQYPVYASRRRSQGSFVIWFRFISSLGFRHSSFTRCRR